MLLRRSPILPVIAGLAAGGALLGAASLATAAGSDAPPTSPVVGFQTASDDDAADDVSGPCDEAEHANDPRCAGVAAPAGAATSSTTSSTTSTTSTTSTPTTPTTSTSIVSESPATGSGATERTLDAAGAGLVRYSVSGATLALLDAAPAAGWTVEVEQRSGDEIDLDFRSGTRRVQVDIEVEDGSVRERVRLRDDADDSETRIENGTVVDDSDRDNSGSGSSDDTDTDDDDTDDFGGDDDFGDEDD